MFLFASLVAVAAHFSPVAAPADTALAVNRGIACDFAGALSPSVVNDLRAALDAHGGAVRWDLGRAPVRLWVQRRPDMAADVSVTAAEWRRVVSAAADAWRGVVPGLQFTLELDSTRADVIVTWERDLESAPAVGELAFRTAGRTTLVPGTDGRALTAHVRLAVFAPGGVRYSVEDVRAVARHELGHALGLAHHGAPTSVMAPLVRAEQLTDEDRATLRALYALPIGARCRLS
jgi:Matrixin